jgi:hypothetical protein
MIAAVPAFLLQLLKAGAEAAVGAIGDALAKALRPKAKRDTVPSNPITRQQSEGIEQQIHDATTKFRVPRKSK